METRAPVSGAAITDINGTCSKSNKLYINNLCPNILPQRDLEYFWKHYYLEVAEMCEKSLSIGTYNSKIDSTLNASDFGVLKDRIYNLFPRLQPADIHSTVDSEDTIANE